jgi:hypothetical protein
LNFRSKEIFLCEISYAVHLADLIKRLKGWHDNWDGVTLALVRDSFISEMSWPVRPWLFVPKERVPLLEERLGEIANGQALKFVPKITPLEDVQPWRYPYNRETDCETNQNSTESQS